MSRETYCINVVAKSADISEAEARQIVKDTMAERKRLSAEGSLVNAEKQLQEFAIRQGEAARTQAAIDRKNVALAVIARDKLDERVRRFESDVAGSKTFFQKTKDILGFEATENTYVESLRSILVGSHLDGFGASNSVDAVRLGINKLYMGGLVKEISALPGVERLLAKDERFIDDVVREMYEIKPNGKRGVTGNNDAAKVAEIFAKYSESMRTRLNAAGAAIGKLDGWSPQSHDAYRISKAGRKAWKKKILPLLDVDRSFEGATDVEIDSILDRIFERVAYGALDERVAQSDVVRATPKNYAKRLGKSRVLHFKDADAWLEYHGEFGTRNLVTAMFAHIDNGSRNLALMETLGPNPAATMQSMIESATKRIAERQDLSDAQKSKMIGELKRNRIAEGKGTLARSMRVVTGEANIPESVSLAKFGVGVRNFLAAARLGAAMLSQLPDTMVFAANARHNGMNLFDGYNKAFSALVQGLDKGEVRELSRSLGTMIDGVVEHVLSRWNAQDSMPGNFGKTAQWVFKWSGMNYWTDAMKAGYARMFSNRLASLSGKAWDDIGVEMQVALHRHGWGKAEWDAVRATEQVEARGEMYIVPERVQDLPDSVIDSLISKDIEKYKKRLKGERLSSRIDLARTQAKRQLETDLMRIIADETRSAVIEPDARTRQLITGGGLAPGTGMGEAARFVMQFKSFPLAYTQRMLRSKRWRNPAYKTDIAGVAHLFAATLVLGYASMSLKDISKGRAPRDPSDVETWFAAALQGGGAGLYGDFFLGESNRFGGGIIPSMAGPAAGTFGEIFDNIQRAKSGDIKPWDIAKTPLGAIPYVNLWYTRGLWQYLVAMNIREMLAPGSISRMERNIMKKNNQEWLVEPTDVIKRGGGIKF